MSIIQAIILGVVQGLTEFLPVSSSAHLALVPYLFDWNLNEDAIFLFGVLVQMGTLIAVLVYFRHDLWTIIKAFLNGIASKDPFGTVESKMGWFLIVGTIPAGIAGLLFDDLVEQAFSTPLLIALFLLVTALLLFLAERLGGKTRGQTDMTFKDALLIGLAQALALFPGISRSGSTITAGMLRGFKRVDASRYSFLLSIPVMLAAGLLSILDLFEASMLSEYLVPLLIATITAGVTGFFAIKWMIGFVSKKPFTGFSIYCAAVSIITIVITLIRG